MRVDNMNQVSPLKIARSKNLYFKTTNTARGTKLNLSSLSDEVLLTTPNFFNGSSFENNNDFFIRYKIYSNNFHIKKILNNKHIMNILQSEFNLLKV